MEVTRILMLEDDDSDEELIRRELRHVIPPPEIRRVTTEAAFMAALSDFSPDVILCDHNVPSFGGRIALAAAQRVAPDVPVILVTGSLDEETAVSYLKAGASDYILKDRLVRLGPAVTDALARAREREERRLLEQQLLQSQKMEAVGQLAGGVAHDFNNILTAIVGYTDLLAAEFGAGSRQHEDLEEIRKAARRAAALTRQLLSFSRKQVLEPRIIDVNGVVLNLDKMLRSLISENIELRLQLADDLEAARVDPNQLEQVIMNLAINARDAMPGGGTLTVETANATLDEDYAARHVSVIPGDYVMLAVTDTGCGMTDQTKARIFEPFFTTKPIGQGTGLGLSTVYGIVKQSGGNIWLYSEPNKGTTFKIYLPAIESLPEDIGKAAPVDTSARGAGTILLVEDDEQLRRLTHRALAGKGYVVLEADRGRAALDIARRHEGTIDLLLTDIVMPDTNGRKLADTLRAARPGLRVLYMSGYPDNAIVNHGLIGPDDAYVAKPFTTDAITRKVQEVLGPR
jgi:two-component system, cell cycle sensor histidine kinase and response regulator CckA